MGNKSMKKHLWKSLAEIPEEILEMMTPGTLEIFLKKSPKKFQKESMHEALKKK